MTATKQNPSSDPSQSNKAVSQRAQILQLLHDRGPAGATNVELNRICFRYGARLWELRRQGHFIQTENRGNGVFAFVLGGKPANGSKSEFMCRRQQEQASAMPLFAAEATRA